MTVNSNGDDSLSLAPISPTTVADWLARFVNPDDVAELRALHVTQRYGKPATVAGFYDSRHLADMAAEALRLTGLARGVYLTMNPLKAEILARCANRTKIAESGDLASDQHVDRRRWLLIDVDPVRIAGISATEVEKAAALDVADAIGRHLGELGWPAPMTADSGNGWHLFYRLDLPADDDGLIQRCLAALAQRFDTEDAKVDTSVFNPARIVKIPGTLARKGDPTLDRPHRRGAIVKIPATILPAPLELMEALAAEVAPKVSATVPLASPASATSSPAEQNGKASRKHRLDVARWLSDRGVSFKLKDAKDGRGRTVYALDACPFNGDHQDAAVLQGDDGKLAFHCFHDSCNGRGWQHCKEAIGKPDPDHWDPPLRGKDEDDEKDEGGSHAVLLTNLALAAVQLFHDGDTAYSSVAETPATFPLESKAFRKQLSHWFFMAKRRVPSGEAIKSALDTLAGKALFTGPNIPVHVRLAELDGAIYLDLGREDWAAVKITPDGWELLSDYPVRFRHPRGLKSLPLPVRGGKLSALRNLLNVHDDANWRLLMGWLLAAFRPTGPYPVLILSGEQGAAKSTTARLLRYLLDPNAAPLRSEPRDARDLVIAASNSWVLALDNLSYLPAWLSDCLCRLSTGGGFATRELYSDAEEVLFDSQRPVILTSIEDIAERGDLLDRAIVDHLLAIPENCRRLESELWAAAEAARPAILGAILDVVAAGMRNLPHVQLDRLPRMADFAAWVTACEPALGWPAGSFLDAYRGNVADANELALDGSLVWPILRQLLADLGTWEGSAAELLAKLNELAGETAIKAKEWPKKPNVLAGRLRRLAPNMRRAGVDVAFDRTTDRTRKRTIRLVCKTSSASSASSAHMGKNKDSVSVVDDTAQFADDPEQLADDPSAAPDQGNPAVRTIADDADDLLQPFSGDSGTLFPDAEIGPYG